MNYIKEHISVRLLVLLFGLFLLPFDVHCSGYNPYKEIKVHWKDNRYVANKPVSSATINKIIDIAHSGPQAEWYFPSTKVNWLKSNVDKAIAENASQLSPRQTELFKREFVDLHRKPRYNLRSRPLFLHRHTDKLMLRLEITTPNDYIEIESQSIIPFLAPWYVNTSKGSHITYSRELSRHMRALFGIPSIFAKQNHYTLRGIISMNIIDNEIAMDSNSIKLNEIIGPQAKPLTDSFVVSKLCIKKELHNGLFHENTSLTLIPKQSFTNIRFEVNATLSDLQANYVNEVHAIVFSIFNKVKRTPQLRKLLNSFPTHSFHFKIHKGSTFGQHVQFSFKNDFTDKYGNKILAEVMPRVLNSIVLRVREKHRSDNCSTWLLLPDRRIALWEFSGERVLNWPKNLFAHTDLGFDNKVLSIVPWPEINCPSLSWFGTASKSW